MSLRGAFMPGKVIVVLISVFLFFQGTLSAAADDGAKQLRRKVADLRKENAKLVEELHVQNAALARSEKANSELKKRLEQTAAKAEGKRRAKKKKTPGDVNGGGTEPAPGDAILYNELGNGYLKNRQFEEAINAFEKALSVEADNAAACYNLGLLYKQQRNDPAKAAVYLKRYLALAPLAKDGAEVKYLIRMLECSEPAYP